MTTKTGEFWSEMERYHDLAEMYERNIEVTHPDYVTSDNVGHELISHSKWGASNVIYHEYRGPRPQS